MRGRENEKVRRGKWEKGRKGEDERRKGKDETVRT